MQGIASLGLFDWLLVRRVDFLLGLALLNDSMMKVSISWWKWEVLFW